MKAAQNNQIGTVLALVSVGSNKDLQNKVCENVCKSMFGSNAFSRCQFFNIAVRLCLMIYNRWRKAGRMDCRLHCRS
jgi:hypothetical protein